MSQIYNIVQKKNLWFSISLTIIFAGFFLMGYRALNQVPYLNYGIDFTGGTQLMLRLDSLSNAIIRSEDNQSVHHEYSQEIREVLSKYNLERSLIQITSDAEVIIRVQQLSSAMRIALFAGLEERFGEMELLEVDMIGPSIGEELKRTSLWIILFVTISLLVYCSWRFEWAFGVSAIMALVHDACVMIAFAAFFNIEVNTAFVAAVLTILGYSVNDTIVIFDRIRENLHKHRKEMDSNAVVNLSIYQMLGRTFHTSFTTLMVVLALILFGGTMIKTFSLVLLVGICSGTYSSLFVASPLLSMIMGRR